MFWGLLLIAALWKCVWQTADCWTLTVSSFRVGQRWEAVVPRERRRRPVKKNLQISFKRKKTKVNGLSRLKIHLYLHVRLWRSAASFSLTWSHIAGNADWRAVADNDQTPRLQGKWPAAVEAPLTVTPCSPAAETLLCFPVAISHVSSHHLSGQRGSQAQQHRARSSPGNISCTELDSRRLQTFSFFYMHPQCTFTRHEYISLCILVCCDFPRLSTNYTNISTTCQKFGHIPWISSLLTLQFLIEDITQRKLCGNCLRVIHLKHILFSNSSK